MARWTPCPHRAALLVGAVHANRAEARGWLVRQNSTRWRRVGAMLGTIVLLGLAPDEASAMNGREAKSRAEKTLAEVASQADQFKPVAAKSATRDPARLLAEADLHFRTGQNGPAIDKLNLVTELGSQGKAGATTIAEARMLLGEAYFADDQLYSARRLFELVTDHAQESAYARMGGRAASRLVDIALRTQRLDTLVDVLARVDRMLASNPSDALSYARAKALYGLGRHDDARAQTMTLQGGDVFAQRGAYLEGTALMKIAQTVQAPSPADDPTATTEGEGPTPDDSLTTGSDSASAPDYTEAIKAFERAATMTVEGDDEASRQIRDLSWLAVGRLHYEGASLLRASAAYQKIERESEYFSRALFELAWTYVRLGDYDRSQRALEVLMVLQPGLVDGADAALLRADLLLRAGRYRDAEAAYDRARATYEPLRRQIDDFLAVNTDPATYYDKLTASDVETGHELPKLVIDWAREEAAEERVFAIVDEVSRSRELVRRSRRIATLLRGALASASRVKVFPELRRQLEKVVGLTNELAIARLSLARGMDAEAGSTRLSLKEVRAERQALMARLGEIPTTPGDFSIREAASEKSWNGVSQALQRLELQADHLQALVNGLRRVLADGARFGVTASAATRERYEREIVESEQELSTYRREIDALRKQVEMGRAQSGFGDERFLEDIEVRTRFREVFTQEVELVASGLDGSKSARRFAKDIGPLLGQIASLEAKLERENKRLDSQSIVLSDDMLATVVRESEAVEQYAAQLDTLDESARVLVGEVARENFVRVRKRLRGVVMRADVGLVQKAWEIREQQRYRVRELLRERAQEERIINDELREVLDDSEEGQL